MKQEQSSDQQKNKAQLELYTRAFSHYFNPKNPFDKDNVFDPEAEMEDVTKYLGISCNYFKNSFDQLISTELEARSLSTIYIKRCANDIIQIRGRGTRIISNEEVLKHQNKYLKELVESNQTAAIPQVPAWNAITGGSNDTELGQLGCKSETDSNRNNEIAFSQQSYFLAQVKSRSSIHYSTDFNFQKVTRSHICVDEIEHHLHPPRSTSFSFAVHQHLLKRLCERNGNFNHIVNKLSERLAAYIKKKVHKFISLFRRRTSLPRLPVSLLKPIMTCLFKVTPNDGKEAEANPSLLNLPSIIFSSTLNQSITWIRSNTNYFYISNQQLSF